MENAKLQCKIRLVKNPYRIIRCNASASLWAKMLYEEEEDDGDEELG